MKIVHFISGGDTGGAKTSLFSLMAQLHNNPDVSASLLCIMEGSFTKEARELGFAIKVISQKKRYDFSVISKIAAYIKEEQFDMVHCHGARANSIAIFLRGKVKVPFCTTIHSDYLLDFIGNKYKQWLYTPINEFALKRFRYLLPVTHYMANTLAQRGFKKERLYPVFNGIDLHKTVTFEPKEQFLRSLSVPVPIGNDFVYFGIAARLDPVKGIPVLLQACVKLVATCKNAVILIAGPGTEQEKADALSFIQHNNLEKSVFLTGYLKDIYSFYNAIDVNMLTSLSETFPYALLEGGLMKKATVASDCGGIPEMIENEKTGLLFPKGNADVLAEKLIEIGTNVDLRTKLGNAFYEDVTQRFSSESMASQYIEYYKEFLRKEKKI